MPIAVSISITLLIAAIVLEFILFAAAYGPYFQFGRVSRRIECQSSVASDDALMFLQQAYDAAGFITRRDSDRLFVRGPINSVSAWPRLTVSALDTKAGAVLIAEVRRFMGMPLVAALGVASLLFGVYGCVGLAVSLYALVSLALLAGPEANRLVHLAPVRAELEEIGVRVCRRCGYDLHGLDNRRPCPECGQAGGAVILRLTLNEIQQALTDRALRRRVIAILAMLVGIPLSFLAPLVLGTTCWFAARRIAGADWPWFYCFLAIGALAIPLLYRLEVRTRGEFLADRLMTASPPLAFLLPPLPIVMARGYAVILSPSFASVAVEVFLIGPRLVLNGVRHLFEEPKLSRQRIPRAARVMERLLASQRSLARSDLIQPAEHLNEMNAIIVWLCFQGWIGVSTTSDRIWLFTESREALASRASIDESF